MDEKDIARINELYHKQKEGTLTPEEEAEQYRLRKEYIAAIRTSLRGSLDSTTIVYPDGKRVNLGEKYGHKGKRD